MSRFLAPCTSRELRKFYDSSRIQDARPLHPIQQTQDSSAQYHGLGSRRSNRKLLIFGGSNAKCSARCWCHETRKTVVWVAKSNDGIVHSVNSGFKTGNGLLNVPTHWTLSASAVRSLKTTSYLSGNRSVCTRLYCED